MTRTALDTLEQTAKGTVSQTHTHTHVICHEHTLTFHLDLLDDLDELHLCRHVPHGPHAVCHVFVVQVAVPIVVKLFKGHMQLCDTHTHAQTQS